MKPRALYDKVEAEKSLPPGEEERFNGMGVMGIPFESGHVLALRHFVASSVGRGYTSVWHRNPAKEWSFYADHDPRLTCTRYFGKEAKHTYLEPVVIEWLDDFSFQVSVRRAALTWLVRASSTPATILLNGIGSLLPDSAWRNEFILGLMGKVAGAALGVAKIGLTGIVPNGQHFTANPKTIWLIKESRATMNGVDFGKPAPLKEQAGLADFWIPQKGILAFGQAYFDPYNPQKHSADTTSSASQSSAA